MEKVCDKITFSLKYFLFVLSLIYCKKEIRRDATSQQPLHVEVRVRIGNDQSIPIRESE
jgi:hypothetical protein